jgi:hypothetical protein
LRKRGHLQSWRHAFQGSKLARKSRQSTAEFGGVPYEFLEAVPSFVCTEIERNSRKVSEKFGTHSKAAILVFLAQKSR